MTKPADTKIRAPITERFTCEADGLTIMQLSGRFGAYFRAQVESKARARGGLIVAIENFQTYQVVDRDVVRMTAMVQLEPWDEEGEYAKQREALIMRAQSPQYVPYMGYMRSNNATATEIRVKAAQVAAQAKEAEYKEAEYRMMRCYQGLSDATMMSDIKIWDYTSAMEIMTQVSTEVRDRLVRQFDAVALRAILGSQPVYEAKPATPPPPPKPVPQIRALDLDEASEVALPTQKGRAIDLE